MVYGEPVERGNCLKSKLSTRSPLKGNIVYGGAGLEGKSSTRSRFKGKTVNREFKSKTVYRESGLRELV